MQGFLAESTLIRKAPRPLSAKCGACGLYKQCDTPKMKPSGKGKRRILIVGEAPSQSEDRKGKQFAGESGSMLRRVLEKLDVDLDADCYKTNALICRPPKKANPTKKQIDYCQPNLIQYIEEVKPDVIIPLGTIAVRSLIGWLWKEDPGPISRWVGWRIPCQRLNAWICPNYHPLYLLREKNPVVPLMFKKHLKAAVSLTDRPFLDIPNYEDDVECLTADEAAPVIEKMIKRGGLCTFDYETDRLKPDHQQAEIVCCSICWRGKKTIAYPMIGDALEATKRFLRSDVPKAGSNIKFEERWSRRLYGIKVRNWVWCTMNAAHILDNRKGITSIKFQSFVHLGQESYNDHIEQFFAGKDSNKRNRIKEIDLHELLKYNGLDSLLEYHVAVKQMKEVGYVLSV